MLESLLDQYSAASGRELVPQRLMAEVLRLQLEFVDPGYFVPVRFRKFEPLGNIGFLLKDVIGLGLFGRIRARRTAEMKAAVASQVDAAAAELAADLDTQLANEAKKLDGQVTAGLAQLQEQAQAILAVESKKLEQQLSKQIDKMHVDAMQAIVAESAKLREEVEVKLAKLKATAKAQIKEAITKFDSDMSNGMEEAKSAALAARNVESAIEQEFTKLKAEVKT